MTHIVNIGIALCARLKKLDAEFVSESLALVEWHHALTLGNIALVAHQDLRSRATSYAADPRHAISCVSGQHKVQQHKTGSGPRCQVDLQ